MWAHVVGGIVAEYPVALRDGEAPDQCYAPAYAAECVAVPVGVTPVNGWIVSGTTFSPPTPSPGELSAQAYAAFIAAGLTVASTATPAVSGVYSIGPDDQSSISIEAQFIQMFGKFTTGNTTDLPWQLANGAMVAFPTTAAFLGFAEASGMAVAAAKLASKIGMAMPSNSATIP